MKINAEKWDEFIKQYFVAVLSGIVSGYIIAGIEIYHLTFLLFTIYLVAIVVIGAIIGYIAYSQIGINSKPDNITPPAPPPSSPV
jgi:uncharacterized membrane protein YdbT with pleckstrin-like domain